MTTLETTSKLKREFLFTDDDFNYIKNLIYKVSGIYLTDVKKDMVYGRLAKRVRHLGFNSFDNYCQFLDNNHEHELSHAINAITTNLTYFFRERHHLDLLQSTVLPELERHKPRGRRLRIWSAGCSTGEEPYSIGISLLNTVQNYSLWDARILATDLDSSVIQTSKSGIYDKKRIEPIDPRSIQRWFEPYPEDDSKVIVNDELKKLIIFKELNLMEQWPMAGPFDVIFCRNVVIYFDKPTQQKLYRRFYDLLAPGGYLFLGHSEQLDEFQKNFTLLGKTSFRKS